MTKDFVYGKIDAFEEAGILNHKFRHCLGIDYCSFKFRAGTMQVLRNYYVSDTDQYFEELVKKRFAERQNYNDKYLYTITKQGLEWLSKLLEVRIKY